MPAQETAKHRAKFGWAPVSDVAAVTKARRETRDSNPFTLQAAGTLTTKSARRYSCGAGYKTH